MMYFTTCFPLPPLAYKPPKDFNPQWLKNQKWIKVVECVLVEMITQEDKPLITELKKAIKDATYKGKIIGGNEFKSLDHLKNKLDKIPEPETRYKILKERITKNKKITGIPNFDAATSSMEEMLKDEEETLRHIKQTPVPNLYPKNTEDSQDNKNDFQRPTAPVIALFCNLVKEAGIIPKGVEKSAEAYCKEVCKKFKLKYSDNVRKNFYNTSTRRNISKLNKTLFPIIDEPTRKKLSFYLDGNTKVFA